MPSPVLELLGAARLEHLGTVQWGESVPSTEPGVYLISTSGDPHFKRPAPLTAPISPAAVEQLLEARPELTIDGQRPTGAALIDRLESFWLSDEAVLYIGLAGTSLRKRVSQYYRTPLGARKPHAGGWFLKTLATLQELHVHFAVAESPKESEGRLIGAFVDGVSNEAREVLRDPARPFPFANLEWPPGTRKNHGIKGATEPRR